MIVLVLLAFYGRIKLNFFRVNNNTEYAIKSLTGTKEPAACYIPTMLTFYIL